MKLNDATRIRVTWVYEQEIYLYESVPGTIVSASKPESIRFQVSNKLEDTDNFEVVIRKDKGNYFFKTDYYDNAEQEFPLKPFIARNEMILYYEGSEGRAYFHVVDVR